MYAQGEFDLLTSPLMAYSGAFLRAESPFDGFSLSQATLAVQKSKQKKA
jgi:hypothetical protein